MEEISGGRLVEQLRQLGVEQGGVLLVHTSFRAVRPVEGGPTGLIGALRVALGGDGTLAMPSWGDSDDEPFDPATTPAAADLGVVPDTFWRLPGVKRSAHNHAFAAIGPRAEEILADPLPLPPHIPASPVGRVHDLDGQILLLGVDHSVDTTLHLAETMAPVPYGLPKYCTVVRDGRRIRMDYLENDHCCERFRLAGDWLDAPRLQQRGTVGHAPTLLVRSRDVVAVALAKLRADPLVFLHPPEEECAECDEARASVAVR